MSDSIGKTLKRIREAKQLSIEEVSDKARIPKKHILSIEEDKLQEIGSNFYARGFIKSYVQFLGALDEKAVKEYLESAPKKDTSELVLKGEILPGDWFQKNKKYIKYAVIAIFSAWLAIFGFIQVKKFIKGVWARQQAKLSEKKAAPKVEPETKAKEPVAEKAKELDKVNLEISANYNTWIQVVGDGTLLFRGILKKGSKDMWAAKKEIRLEVGNAGGVSLKVNEKNLGVPGKKGEIKEIVITKDGII